MGVLSRYERKLWPIVEDKYEARLEGKRLVYFKLLKVTRPIHYPLKRLYEAWEAISRYGRIVSDAGVPRWRQFVHQMILYARYGLPPISYYKFRLFRKPRREEAEFYVHHKQMDVLLKGVNIVVGAEDDAALLENKLAFFRHCQHHGIPTAPILLVRCYPKTDPVHMVVRCSNPT